MSLEGVELHLVDTVDEAAALMRWLGERPSQLGVIALDTESSGLSPERDFLRLIQISDDKTGWAIPFPRWGGVVEEIVKKWSLRYRMHNATHDVSFLAGEGIRVPRNQVDDTRLAGHVLESTASTALKNQASRHVDPRAASLQRQLDHFMQGWTWGTVPICAEGSAAIYWQYGALDAILTFQLGDVHLPRVRSEAPEAYELELGVAWVVSDMARRGTRVDREYARTSTNRLLQEIENIETWCKKQYGINPASSPSVLEVLQRETDYKFNVQTAGGALSLSRDVLIDIVEQTQHPLARAVLRRRQAQKVESAFLRQFLEYSEYDGFLHPSINSVGGSGKQSGTSEGEIGVRTGRMSMDHPNLQALTRTIGENPFAPIPRNCIVPRDEHHTLLMSDLDQIEMRIFAWLAADPGMKQAFNSDVDFFTSLARTIYEDDSIAKGDPRRQTTKSTGYAKAYFAGPNRLAETAGITPEQARKIFTRFDELYPGVQRLQRRLESTAKQRLASEGTAYVRSPFTNRRHVADRGTEYKLLNRLIQGVCAELLKIKILEADAAGLGEYMILPVHDEIILDVPTDLLEDAAHKLRGIMNDDRLLTSVPITAGIAYGKRWGEKKEWSEE